MMIALAAVYFIGATHYGPQSGRNADGSSYACRHVASRRYYGKRITVVWHEGHKRRVLRNVPVRDKSGRDVIDFPDRMFDRFFGPGGRRLQPRHGWPVRVVVLGRVRSFGKPETQKGKNS